MTNWHLNFLHRMLTLFTFNHKHTCLQTKISDYLRNRNWNYNIIQLQIFLEKLILYVYITLFVIFWRPTVDCKRCETQSILHTEKVKSANWKCLPLISLFLSTFNPWEGLADYFCSLIQLGAHTWTIQSEVKWSLHVRAIKPLMLA